MISDITNVMDFVQNFLLLILKKTLILHQESEKDFKKSAFSSLVYR